MASERIVFGADLSEAGNYRLCWTTGTEGGELETTVRNVVVTEVGGFFYMQFADEAFRPYRCDHPGLRCDLIDPNVGWFILNTGDQHVELGMNDLIREGDFTISLGEKHRINSHWFGLSLSTLRMLHRDARVFRPVVHPLDMEGLTSCDIEAGAYDFAPRTPGLQATG